MASRHKRERMRSNRLFRKHARHAEGLDGSVYDVPRSVSDLAIALWSCYQTRLVGRDDRDGSLYPEPWLAVMRSLTRDKRHNTRLLGFYDAKTARRIHYPAEEMKQALKAEGVPEEKVADVILYMPVYLEEHIARGNIEVNAL